MNLREKFLHSLDSILLSEGNDFGSSPILLAVSGGIDSVVMAHLFHLAGRSCAVAHCNFSLRGEESDGDEEFVKQLSQHYKFLFHSKRFSTEAFASDNGISIQMAARQLRYQYFGELMETSGYAFTAVAHHADDVAETMLINLTRGTGIAGMHGIARAKGNIIRPLLNFTRDEIIAYAEEHHLVWRDDRSNNEEVYTRNRIRHSVLPLLKEINPSVMQALNKHASLMSGYEKIIDEYINSISNKLIRISHAPEAITIDLLQLKSLPAPDIILYHLLSPYGFNATECNQALESQRTGATFHAPGYKLMVGRNTITVIGTDQLDSLNEFIIHESDTHTDLPFGTITMEKIDSGYVNEKELPSDFISPDVAYIDSSNLQFPLTVRRWQTGDTFHPLGMKGKKLLSDFFTDEKFSPAQKESVLLLLSGTDVVWVIGYRIDNRFKITEKTVDQRKFTWKTKMK